MSRPVVSFGNLVEGLCTPKMSSSGATVTGLEDVLSLSTTKNHFQPQPFPRLVTHLSFLHFKPTQEIAVDHNTINRLH